MQVETIYTFKSYLYIAHPVCSDKIKSRRISWGQTIIPLALVGYGYGYVIIVDYCVDFEITLRSPYKIAEICLVV